MVSRHGFDAAELEALFARVERRQSILDAIAQPAEAKPWHEYRPIFVTEDRIVKGVEFWNAHADTLARASREFGVDAEIIVAIIGVETRYGSVQGRYPVIAALATLGFDYPPRSVFFQSELEHYLLLVREEGLDPLATLGSYAGAMGAGQFMPSSFRAYAVDFDGDGHRDLWQSWPDIIGSVANYLARHGWKHGEPVVVPAVLRDGASEPARESPLALTTAGTLREAFVFTAGLADTEPALYVALDGATEREYWIGLNNFWVITRYNRSALYAMAVWQLAQEIVRHRTVTAGN